MDTEVHSKPHRVHVIRMQIKPWGEVNIGVVYGFDGKKEGTIEILGELGAKVVADRRPFVIGGDFNLTWGEMYQETEGLGMGKILRIGDTCVTTVAGGEKSGLPSIIYGLTKPPSQQEKKA